MRNFRTNHQTSQQAIEPQNLPLFLATVDSRDTDLHLLQLNRHWLRSFEKSYMSYKMLLT